MAGEWRETSLASVAVISSGKRPARVVKEPAGDCQIPVIGGGGPSGYTDSALFDGGILITGRVGTLGKLFAPTGPCWPSDNALVVRPKSSETDARFLRYALHQVIAQAPGMNRGAANPLITQGDLGRLRIGHPSLPEQRAIAHILGTLDDEIQAKGGESAGLRRLFRHLLNKLISGQWIVEEGKRWLNLTREIIEPIDDKIELNRRMSETLEAMARALFQSWFVDFDPVRAKMEGRWRRGESHPGLPAHFYDLFPDRFVESELGEIPEGWEVGKLGDVADHPRRSIAPESIEPDTPYIALEHMPRQCITLSKWDVADGLESNKFEFRKGEILFGKLRPYFHKVGVAPVDGVCSTDIVVVAPKSEDWCGFVLGHMSSVEFVEHTNAGSTGTKMPRTSWAEMTRYTVALPPQVVASAFTARLQPFVDRIIDGIHESRTLVTLRDSLLPRLISGELRVKDAERFIGRAM